MASRRGRGEGSIYRRKVDGLWIGAVTLEETGKKRYVSGDTRQEVQRRLTAMQREIEQGLSPGDGRQTLSHYLTSWLETIKPTMGEGAWVCHEIYVRRHFIPRLGRVKLAKLTPQMVQGLYAALLSEAGLSSTTVNHMHGSLHKALDAAVRLRLIGSNATDFVDVPRIVPQEIHPLMREQARALLDAASFERYGERLEALFVLALATGMRQGELLALHWRDVDLTQRSLSVRWNLRYRGGVFTFKEPKTKRSRRRLALAPQTVDALRAHRTRQLEERLYAADVWEDNDLVFSTPIGTPLSPHGSLRSAFKRAMKRAGLSEAVRFHDLRHTCATLALSGRVNPKVVSEMLGHSTVAITLDIYSHVMPDMQEDAAAVIGGLLYG